MLFVPLQKSKNQTDLYINLPYLVAFLYSLHFIALFGFSLYTCDRISYLKLIDCTILLCTLKRAYHSTLLKWVRVRVIDHLTINHNVWRTPIAELATQACSGCGRWKRAHHDYGQPMGCITFSLQLLTLDPIGDCVSMVRSYWASMAFLCKPTCCGIRQSCSSFCYYTAI